MIRRGTLLALASSFLLSGCDGLFGPDVGPPSQLAQSTVPSEAPVGSALTVTITIEDDEGRPVEGAEVIWSATGGGTTEPAESTADAEGVATATWTLGTAAGEQTLTAAVGSLDPVTFTVESQPGPISLVAVVHDGRVLHALGDTLHLQAVGTDAFGNVLPGDWGAWSSLETGVATVADGVVTAIAEGTARVVATVGSHADTVLVEVDQIVAGMGVMPAGPLVLVKDETLQLTAVAVDSNGVEVDTTVAVAWSSSAAGVATVSATGLVSAVAVGEVTITADGGALVGEAGLDVRAGPRPTVSSITPAVATPGDTLTISGAGFAATPGLNGVTVAGTEALVLTASATELTVSLAHATLPCGPTSDVDVLVTADGLAMNEPVAHPLAGAAQRDMAVGESLVLHGADTRCNELLAPGRYMLTVFNTTTSPTARTPFRLRGTTSEDVAAAPADAAFDALPRRAIRVSPRVATRAPRPEATAHARLLDRNLRLGEELAARARAAGTAALRSPVVTADPVPTVGSYMDVRIPDIDTANACTNYRTVTARVVHVGTRGVILEDTVAPLAGSMDDTFAQVGEEFDQVMFPVLEAYFGDPLVYDASLDDNGRLFMLFSEEVNEFDAGIAGFVFSGDLFTRASCASSDGAEIFYGRVPTTAGSGFDGDTPDSWRRTMRSTVIHEVKHITSFAHRYNNDASSWEDSWLEESTARLSEELYAREVFGYGIGENVDYASSIHCEVRPTASDSWPECVDTPWVMGKHFQALDAFYGDLEALSPIGPAVSGDWTFYGSGWLLVRAAIDQSGRDEATFIRELIDETLLSGVESLVARAGRPFEEILADYYLAIAADDYPSFTPERPEISFPGWNTRDIFQGFYDDFHEQHPSEYPEPFPLLPRQVSFGAFDLVVDGVQGGGGSIVELSGTLGGTQLLELLGTGGQPADGTLGLGVVRVQ